MTGSPISACRAESIELGFQANEQKPVFHSHDRFGHRIDAVSFHPAYHQLMRKALTEGLHSEPWISPGQGAHVHRAARYYMHVQVEAAHGCPVTMTFAAVPAIQKQQDLAKEWLPRILNKDYDPRNVPHTGKQAVTIGMAMTEKQGGSDVRRNSTRAYPLAAEGPGKTYELEGDEGRGVNTIIDMVAMTRFDCMIGSSGGMRQAVSQAIHHCQHREAFGAPLVEQPLMQNVLADLALESEAALAMTLRMAYALDHPADAHEQALLRMGAAIGKYWICKRTPQHAYEAMECIGGSGLMEDSIMPRLLRESPVNSIWEGSGNVQCLDMLRASEKNPESLQAFMREIKKAQGDNERLDDFVSRLETDLADADQLAYRARNLADILALALQASLLLRGDAAWVGQAFCKARLAPPDGLNFGNLPVGVDCAALIKRAGVSAG